MIISLKFREQMSGFLTPVLAEFDNIIATLRQWSNVEHTDSGTHSPNVGNLLSFLAGANIGGGQVCYVSAGNNQTGPGQAFLADATTISKSTHAAIVGLATNSVSAGDNVVVRDRGIFSGLVGLNAGTVYFVSTTPGAMTATAPTNAARVGLAISSTELLIMLIPPTTIIGPPVITWTGTTSGTVDLGNVSPISFTAGTYSITVANTVPFTFKGVGGGGGGGGNGTIRAFGGGGGGSACATTSTTVTLNPDSTYTLVVGAGGAENNNGNDTTLSGSIEGSIIVLKRGNLGAEASTGPTASGGTGGQAASSTGSNLVSGVTGGNGSSGAGTNGSQGNAAATGAGAGGGGGGNDGTQHNGGSGGNGVESGQAQSGGTGGRGGGYQVVGISGSFGYGGGGARGSSTIGASGTAGGDGVAVFVYP